MSSPINVTWTGDSFEPANRFWASKCDQRFVVGQAYTLDEVHARSSATHAHYFAVLHDIWQSLPERMSEKFPDAEALRKYALIRTGYRTETQHVCKTPAEAERLAAAIKPYDTYQIVQTDEAIVTVYNAISQDMRSMDKQTFQRSKEAVLDFCSELVGIEPAETRRLAGMAPNNSPSDATPSPASENGDAASPPEASSKPEDSAPSESSGSHFGKWNYEGDDLRHLREFSEKGIREYRRAGEVAASVLIEAMHPQYRGLLKTADAVTALESIKRALELVLKGDRNVDRVEAWISTEFFQEA